MQPSLNGLHCLSFESRRSSEMATLIGNYGGRATVAPSMREVPLDDNPAALDFAERLDRGEFDVVIFLTGVGTRILMQTIAGAFPRERFAEALSRAKVVARGPKPQAVLRELQVPIWVNAPEPNTSHEVLEAIDAAAAPAGIKGCRIAIQEYGASSDELVDGLRAREAEVTSVPVYQWALPEDVTPLRDAITAVIHGEVDVVFFTTRVQVVHLYQVASELGLTDDL